MKYLTIEIEDLDTASSADNLTKALKLIQGAHRIYVNVEAHQANIEYDDVQVSAHEFIEVIQKAGYTPQCICPP